MPKAYQNLDVRQPTAPLLQRHCGRLYTEKARAVLLGKGFPAELFLKSISTDFHRFCDFSSFGH